MTGLQSGKGEDIIHAETPWSLFNLSKAAQIVALNHTKAKLTCLSLTMCIQEPTAYLSILIVSFCSP